MDTKQQTVYTLTEFNALAKRLRGGLITPEELERRKKLPIASDRFLREMEPIQIPVEDLIHRDRRYDG